MSPSTTRTTALLRTIATPSGFGVVVAGATAGTGLLTESPALAAIGVVGVALSVLYRLARFEHRTRAIEQRLTRRLELQHDSIAELRSTVAEQRLALREAEGRSESIAKSLASLSDAVGQLAAGAETQRETLTLVRQRVARERSQRIVGVTHGLTRGTEPDRITLLVSIHRAASTLLLDILRSLPGHGLWPTAEFWMALGLDGRRYPADLSDGPNGTIELEVTPGRGVLIPSVDDARYVIPRTAVEKLHPEFYGYDEERFADAIATVGARVPIRMVYLVRRPLDSMWSMAEYKTRRPQWYASLDVETIPEVIAGGLASIDRLRGFAPGPLLTYDDVVRRSDEMIEILAQLSDSDPAEVRLASGEPSSPEGPKGAQRESGFLGPRDRNRTIDGPDGRWCERRPLIDDATTTWQNLVDQKSES